MTYRVFHRTWWKENKDWPNGLEPDAGTKHHIIEVETIEEAKKECREYNRTHSPGRLSDKAEFEQN